MRASRLFNLCHPTPEFNLGDDEFLQLYVSNQIKDFNNLNRYDLSLTTLGMGYSTGLGENNTKTLDFLPASQI